MFALTIAGVGCTTTVGVRSITNTPVYRDDVVEVSARVIGVDELNEAYGIKNPFIAPTRLLTPFEFLIFEISIAQQDGGSANIPISGAALNFNGIEGKYMSINRLTAFWEGEITQNDESIVTPRYREVIRANLLPNSVGSSAVGLLVFRGTFPKQGTITVTVPYPAVAGGDVADSPPVSPPLAPGVPPGVPPGSVNAGEPVRTPAGIELYIGVTYREEQRAFSLF